MYSDYLFISLLISGVVHAADPFDVQAVKNVMLSKAKSAWELGTVAEALLELDNGEYSVFGSSSFSTAPASISSLSYASGKITLNSATLYPESFSNADPASLGVAAVMLGKTKSQYQTAATLQLNTLLYNNPRSSAGAISHRSSTVQLWSDSIYMFPPFFAYYAASTNNATLLAETVTQLQLYRAALKQADGTWAHIQGGHADPGKWSTGNGWASMGMTRVLATILNGPFSASVKSKYSAEVTGWIKEIIDGAIASARASNGLLHNYLGNSSTFGETSGTSMLAAVVYRMAVISPGTFGPTYVSWAKASLTAVSRFVGSGGIISPAVDPYSYTSNTPYTVGSPEGQAFAVMLYAAHRDCVAAKVCAAS